MVFTRPTLPELVTRIREDFRGRLGITGSLLRRSMADVLAIVWAGASHMMHGHLQWVSRQIHPQTADDPGVIRAAGFYMLSRTPATFAAGTVTATGSDGAPIPAETILARDDGATYRVTAGAVISSGSALLSVEAVTAGADGEMLAGDSLVFETPVAMVDASVSVTTDIEGGNDQEEVTELLDRLLLRVNEPSAGGTGPDYEAWALAVAGVTRAWVYPHELGLGTVVVRFVLDGEAVIFPTPVDVALVQTALDEQRPITAEVTAAAATELLVDVTVSITPDTPEIRSAVTASLDDFIRRVSEAGDGLGRGTIFLSQMQTAVGVSAGITDYLITSPAADVVPAVGALATLGTITWA